MRYMSPSELWSVSGRWSGCRNSSSTVQTSPTTGNINIKQRLGFSFHRIQKQCFWTLHTSLMDILWLYITLTLTQTRCAVTHPSLDAHGSHILKDNILDFTTEGEEREAQGDLLAGQFPPSHQRMTSPFKPSIQSRNLTDTMTFEHWLCSNVFL